MAKAPKLNDLQLILLSSASQREDGSLLPLPDSAAQDLARVRKDVEALLKRNLVAETPTAALNRMFREEDDQRLGVIITEAGRAAIGLVPSDGSREEEGPAKPNEIRAGTKQSLLLGLIQRKEGASLDQIVEATGWLPHTSRAAITGLRKRGHVISLENGEGGSRYRCTKAAAE